MKVFGFILLTAMLTPTQGAGSVVLTLNSFENAHGLTAEGAACPTAGRAGHQVGHCDTTLTVCLRPVPKTRSVRRRRQPLDCEYNNGSKPLVLRNYFWNSVERPKPSIELPFSWNWTGRFHALLMFSHHDQEGNAYPIAELVLPESLPLLPSNGTVTTVRQLGYVKANISLRVACAEHYFGEDCYTYCNGELVDVRGFICDANGTKVCAPGWRGPDCKIPICRPGCKGSCKKPGQCLCEDGWEGDTCGQCVRRPGCVNGYCSQPYECICFARWGGLHCSKDQDVCYHRAPCRNNARCVPHEPDNYTCHCPPGFTGKDCEIATGHCIDNPCQNGGTCVNTPHGFLCNCPLAFRGQRCEDLVYSANLDACIDTRSGRVHEHGAVWETEQCHECRCINGKTSCSRPRCHVDNCLLQTSVFSDRCPANQVCRSLQQGDCLAPPCAFPKGQCQPRKWLVRNVDVEQGCERAGRECDVFFVTLDQERLPIGTSTEDVCYHILAYVLFVKEIYDFVISCQRVTTSPLLLKVSMRCYLPRCPVTGLRAVLMAKLHLNQTASELLGAVTGVAMGDVPRASTTVEGTRVTTASTQPPQSHVFSLLITTGLSLLLLLVVGATVGVYCLRQRIYRRAKPSNLDVSPVSGATFHIQNNLRKDITALNEDVPRTPSYLTFDQPQTPASPFTLLPLRGKGYFSPADNSILAASALNRARSKPDTFVFPSPATPGGPKLDNNNSAVHHHGQGAKCIDPPSGGDSVATLRSTVTSFAFPPNRRSERKKVEASGAKDSSVESCNLNSSDSGVSEEGSFSMEATV